MEQGVSQKNIDFLGLGAQKAGPSWLYACLYEHPEICSPIKEVHFFSRPRFQNGQSWYERQFRRCPSGKRVGEFSTSYLFSAEAPARIASLYPGIKLIAVLRHPLERAYSEYGNAIKAGEIDPETTFDEYIKEKSSCLEQGRYAEQLARYDEHFNREQLLVLVYEDIAKDPLAFVQRVYAHLGVDANFVPPSLTARINIARVPKHVWIDRVIHKVAEWLRRAGLDRFVHLVKRSGITDAVRTANTRSAPAPTPPNPAQYQAYFSVDIAALSKRLGRDMHKEWSL